MIVVTLIQPSGNLPNPAPEVEAVVAQTATADQTAIVAQTATVVPVQANSLKPAL